MKIGFRLAWLKPGRDWPRGFKIPEAAGWFRLYADRIAKFVPVQIAPLAHGPSRRASVGWLCDRGRGSKTLASEEIARQLKTLMNRSVSGLEIFVGGADGFSEADRQNLAPDLVWSFGPATYPHELAAVMAAEQIYRALTVVYGLPYHCGH